MQVCPKRVIYSKLSRGGCSRNLGEISDFALDTENWNLPFSHVFVRNTNLNVGDLHKNRGSVWWLSAASESQNKCYIFIWEIFWLRSSSQIYSQSKIKIRILNQNDFFFLFFPSQKYKSRKAGKNCIRLSHHFGFVLKWNITNQVAFSAYPCKLLRKVNLNHSQVCNLALQHFGLKMSKKVFFQHLWLIYSFIYRVFYLDSSQSDLWYPPAGPSPAQLSLEEGGCFSMIRLDHLHLPALRKNL